MAYFVNMVGKLEKFPITREALAARKEQVVSAFIQPKEVHARYLLERDDRIAFSRGHGRILDSTDDDTVQEMLEKYETEQSQVIKNAQDEQKQSLSSWITYLSDPDAPYPDDFIELVLSSVVEMTHWHELEERFFSRTSDSEDLDWRVVAPFPELDQEVLAKVYEGYRDLQEVHNPTRLEELIKLRKPLQKALRSLGVLLGLSRRIDSPDDITNSNHSSFWSSYSAHQGGEKRFDPNWIMGEIKAIQQQLAETDEEYKRLRSIEQALQQFSFKGEYSLAYAEMLNFVEADPALYETTEGSWIKYPQGSDAAEGELSFQYKDQEYSLPPLAILLQESARIYGVRTGWCTAGESTAQEQLDEGDFYVYVTEDSEGKPCIPRIAIRMEVEEDEFENQFGDLETERKQVIGEVRGIAGSQHIETQMLPVVQDKLKDFEDGESYLETSKSMQTMTYLYWKLSIKGQPITDAIRERLKQDGLRLFGREHTGLELTLEELAFLYQFSGAIIGFGFDSDPRIAEAIALRESPVDDFNRLREEFDTIHGYLDLSTFIYSASELERLNLRGLTCKRMFDFPYGVTEVANLDLSGSTFEGMCSLRGLEKIGTLSISGASFEKHFIVETLEEADTIDMSDAYIMIPNFYGLQTVRKLSAQRFSTPTTLHLAHLTEIEEFNISGAEIGALSLHSQRAIDVMVVSDDTSIGSLDIWVEVFDATKLSKIPFSENLEIYQSNSIQNLSLEGRVLEGTVRIYQPVSRLHNVNLRNAQIGRDCEIRSITTAEGIAFTGMQVGKDLTMRDLKSAQGLNLKDVHIKGSVYMWKLGSLAGGTFDTLRVDGDIFLFDATDEEVERLKAEATIAGEVHLTSRKEDVA